MSRRTMPLPCLGLALALLLAGCGGSHKKTTTPAPGAEDSDAVTYDRSRCAAKEHRLVRLTTREDGKPDIWKFYAATSEGGTTIEILVCKQVDINHDGKVDLVVYYDREGRVAKEELDLNFDGRFDQVAFYEGGKPVRKEYDRNGDGKPDVWAFYEGGKLVRVERDSKYRGKVDVWEHYEAGRLDRVGYDTTGSGAVDRWERAPERPDDDEPESTGGASR